MGPDGRAGERDVLLVEQNADMALKLSDDGYVLENGTIVMKGNAHDLARSDAVREAYIGLQSRFHSNQTALPVSTSPNNSQVLPVQRMS